MIASLSSRVRLFWKIYAIIVAIDLLVYIAIFYAGKMIPPESPTTSFPGNYGLCMWWYLAHFPSCLLFFRRVLPDQVAWLAILQDVWLAGLIALIRIRAKKDA